MAFQRTRLNRPLSRLEISLSIILIAVFFAVIMKRLAMLDAMGESRALEMTIRNLRMGTMLYVSNELLSGRLDRIVALTRESPVGRVIDAPGGYTGALHDAHAANIKPGQWYYDLDDHTLVYYIAHGEYFHTEGRGPKRVRIKMKLEYRDNNHNGVYDADIDRPTGIRVDVLDKFKWDFQGAP